MISQDGLNGTLFNRYTIMFSENKEQSIQNRKERLPCSCFIAISCHYYRSTINVQQQWLYPYDYHPRLFPKFTWPCVQEPADHLYFFPQYMNPSLPVTCNNEPTEELWLARQGVGWLYGRSFWFRTYKTILLRTSWPYRNKW